LRVISLRGRPPSGIRKVEGKTFKFSIILCHEMTRKGWKTVLVSEDVYLKAKQFIDIVNERAGFRKIRGLSHLVDMAVSEFLEKHRGGKGL